MEPKEGGVAEKEGSGRTSVDCRNCKDLSPSGDPVVFTLFPAGP